jgi:hypothetical protein
MNPSAPGDFGPGGFGRRRREEKPMTVAELIARLKDVDAEREVKIARYEGDVLWTSEVLTVAGGRDAAHEMVWLQSR